MEMPLKDVGEEIICKLGELNRILEREVKEFEKYNKIFPRFPLVIGEKKNCQIHMSLEKSLLDRLKKQSDFLGIPLADYCRRRLRGIF